MAYCFENANKDLDVKNIYADDYFKAVFGDKEDSSVKEFFKNHFEKTNVGYKLTMNEVEKDLKDKYYKEEERIWNHKCAMKNEAMKLLNKYFYDLWD